MTVKQEIKNYISSQPESKQSEMAALHRLMLTIMPACKLWFLDGRNSENKIVSNPNIGYGSQIIKYADGKTKESISLVSRIKNTWPRPMEKSSVRPA
jgi:hypothetical protein